MTLTQDDILSMDDRAVDHAIAEHVMGWKRLASLRCGATGVDAAWLAEVGRGLMGEVDAPHCVVYPSGQVPDFASPEWAMVLVARMAALGFALSVSGGDVLFYKGSVPKARRSAAEASAPRLEDAIRRAALLAVQ